MSRLMTNSERLESYRSAIRLLAELIEEQESKGLTEIDGNLADLRRTRRMFELNMMLDLRVVK